MGTGDGNSKVKVVEKESAVIHGVAHTHSGASSFICTSSALASLAGAAIPVLPTVSITSVEYTVPIYEGLVQNRDSSAVGAAAAGADSGARGAVDGAGEIAADALWTQPAPHRCPAPVSHILDLRQLPPERLLSKGNNIQVTDPCSSSFLPDQKHQVNERTYRIFDFIEAQMRKSDCLTVSESNVDSGLITTGCGSTSSPSPSPSPKLEATDKVPYCCTTAREVNDNRPNASSTSSHNINDCAVFCSSSSSKTQKPLLASLTESTIIPRVDCSEKRKKSSEAAAAVVNVNILVGRPKLKRLSLKQPLSNITNTSAPTFATVGSSTTAPSPTSRKHFRVELQETQIDTTVISKLETNCSEKKIRMSSLEQFDPANAVSATENCNSVGSTTRSIKVSSRDDKNLFKLDVYGEAVRSICSECEGVYFSDSVEEEGIVGSVCNSASLGTVDTIETSIERSDVEDVRTDDEVSRQQFVKKQSSVFEDGRQPGEIAAINRTRRIKPTFLGKLDPSNEFAFSTFGVPVKL